MTCPKCQHENRGGAKFCSKCGVKLEVECPNCGNSLPGEASFCDQCGHSLVEVNETPPIDYSTPQSYTPKHLADKILTSRSSIEGERKLVTVMFTDVAGSTAMFENLDPEDVHLIMDGCFRILLEQIHKYEGTVNQFRGDGVMALFGAPLAHENHAQRACQAALDIQRAMQGYCHDMQNRFGIDFRMRVGLDTGLVVVGSIGDDLRMDYTADGDTANMASRMESLAQPDTVLVSGNTYNLAGDYFEFDALGRVSVKGKMDRQKVYRLLGSSKVSSRIAASVAKGLTRFVGRQRELEILQESFAKAAAGQGQVVGIVGEAGVGKSRLLFELCNALPPGDFHYLEGHCLHYGSSMPYLPILDIFRSFIGIKEGEAEHLIRERMRDRILRLDENLKNIIPALQELLSLKADYQDYAQLEPKQKRERTFEAIRDLLVRGAQERPIVLAIEDLHWMDQTSQEFLEYMIGWLATTPILLILLYRPEYTHPWGSKSYYSKIGVDQLSSGTSAELVRALLEGGEVSADLSGLILGRAAGNPFFMEELTRSLLENGSIAKTEKQYVLLAEPAEIQVPDTVQGIIAARMDRLQEGSKRTMQLAAVIGREFAFRILHAISQRKEDLKSHLLKLQGLEFIYEKSLFPDLVYIFGHILTQEVAYNSLLLKRRKEIHGSIGRAIEKLYPGRLEEFYEMLAYHYSKSEDTSKAIDYLKLSGDKANGTFSLSEAFQYHKEAVCLLRDRPETQHNKQLRLEILEAIGAQVVLTGHLADSLELLEEGENLARDLGDRKTLARFHTRIGTYYLASAGDPEKGREYIERGLEESELIEEVGTIAPVTLDIVLSNTIQGAFSRTCMVAPKVIDLIEKTNTQHEQFGRMSNVYSMLNSQYGMSLGATGRFVDGERFLKRGLSFAREVNNLISLALVEMAYGSFSGFMGAVNNQIKHYTASIDYLEKSQMRMFLGVAWASLGGAHLGSGNIEKAMQYAVKGLKIHMTVGVRLWLGSIHNTLGAIHLVLGQTDEALVHAEQAVDSSRNNKERLGEAESRITLSRAIYANDPSKFGAARQQILQGLDLLDELEIRPRYAVGLLRLAELCVQSGQADKARENLIKAQDMFKGMGMVSWPDKAQELLAQSDNLTNR
jgi:class 3 adenylate cyclase/tetratricopeptide (TPR) repeat protein